VVWGLQGGGYHGELSVENGEFLDADPWQWEPADELNTQDPHRITWIGKVDNGCDGLEFSVRGSSETTFRLRFTNPYQADVTFHWANVRQGPEQVVLLGEGFDFAAYGSGDIRRGPRRPRCIELPASCHTAPGRLCERAETDEAFRQGVTTYLDNTMPLIAPWHGCIIMQRIRRASIGTPG
jgi:hypothetical protein